LRSKNIIKNFKPDVVIGTGGYASAPLLRVASARNIPCVLQEQNSHAGITNKWLSKKARKICVAYEGMEQFFPSEKIVVTGNPVRQDLLQIDSKREEGISHFKLDRTIKTLLVLGGSLGARKINQLIAEKLSFFQNNNLQIIWQCGKYYFDSYKNLANDTIKIHAFLNKMDLAYAASDFIISRAGALSVSELCLVGKPVFFIPSPNVAEDHQTKNAQSIEKQNAAILIKENDLEAQFEKQFLAVVTNTEKQKKLSEAIKKLAKPQATKDIVNEIKKLLPEN